MAKISDVKIEDNSDKVLKAKDAGTQKALEMIGLQCEKYAKLQCPVDTGRLRNSLTHETRVQEESTYIGTAVEYAPYVEMGTSRMRAQPYLKPAVNDHRDEYKQIAESCLKG